MCMGQIADVKRVKSGNRNTRVEVLRLVAIAGISIFHVFTPWFWVLTHPSVPPAAEHVQAATALASVTVHASWPLVWILGLIAILGSWGNHIFYMISAFYLLPSMVQKVGSRGYWSAQLRANLHRCSIVLGVVVLYASLVVIASRFVSIPGVGTWSWIGPSLEFVWLYILFISLAPIWAVVVNHFADNRLAHAFLLLLVVVTYVINCYIAFVNQGDIAQRGLLNWRKLMSAVTYLISFAVAGVIGVIMRRKQVLHKCQTWTSSSFWCKALLGLLLIMTLITGVWARLGRVDLLYDLSFKSTSLLAFLLAVTALLACALNSGAQYAGTSLVKVVKVLASGILGFYVVQALSYGLWNPLCTRFLSDALGSGRYVRFLLAGALFAFVFALLVVLFDCLVRKPLFRIVGLK